MDLREFIELGIAKYGTATELAKVIGMNANALRDAKSGRQGLPVYACIKLAELIEVTPLEVIAASELVTEKREERRAVFLPFVQQFGRHGHQVIIGSTSMVVVSKMASDMGDFIMCLI